MVKQNSPVRFAVTFIVLFLVFYYFNIMFLGITSPGNNYIPFLANHLDYISALRWVLLHCSMLLLKGLGFGVVINQYELLVAGHGMIRVNYSCLGLGVISFFTAFVLAYPKPLKTKWIFLIAGILSIQFLNVIRFMLLALYWNGNAQRVIDHHTIFNSVIYILISITLYFWVTANTIKGHAKN